MKRIGSSGLGYGQTFVIILGFLITSALIFMFGIWVGRDIVERRLAKEDRAVRGIVPPRPTETHEEADAVFYGDLKHQAEQRLQQTQQASAQTANPRPPATPTAGAPAVAPATAAVAAAAPTHARVELASTPTLAAPAVLATPTAPASSTKATAKPTPPRTPTLAHRPADDEWADAGWTVQVNATTDQEEARNLASRLRARGYDAYVVQAPLRGQTWFRVRVGRLAARDKAKELEERLRRSEGMDAAYITPQ